VLPHPTWSVVVTLKGPAEMAVPFVAHHLETAALCVHVYLDAPDPALESLLAAHPRCQVTVCDDAYWQARRPRKGRPGVIVARQIVNAEDARARSDADWIVHLDSDEFLHEAVPLGAELAAVPADMDWLRLQNVERVFAPGVTAQTIFDGVWRSPLRGPRQAARIWGDDARFLRDGFSAYLVGKIAIRRTSPLHMRLHTARWPDSAAQPDGKLPPFRVARDVHVRHLNGWTPLQWSAKLMLLVETGRADNGHDGRQAQIAYVRDTADPALRAGLYDRLHRLDAGRAAALHKAGALHDMPLDPRPAIARHFPQIAFSYSLADFDARQRAANPDFYQRNGL
jgi:hypothetical protein